MPLTSITRENHIAILSLDRGKVNAINEEMADLLLKDFSDLEKDDSVKSVVLTGTGKFFSFGLDVPELYVYSEKDFAGFLRKFTDLYTYVFMFPKPVIAAINGHAIAGGCMLASACDCRIMVTGKAKISLNEITFGSSVFAGSVEMLRFIAGSKNAEEILKTGMMYSAEQAKNLDLIDRVVSEDELMSEAVAIAEEFSAKDGPAFASIKKLLRGPVVAEMKKREADSIDEFNEIWYSASTRRQLQNIQIK